LPHWSIITCWPKTGLVVGLVVDAGWWASSGVGNEAVEAAAEAAVEASTLDMAALTNAATIACKPESEMGAVPSPSCEAVGEGVDDRSDLAGDSDRAGDPDRAGDDDRAGEDDAADHARAGAGGIGP